MVGESSRCHNLESMLQDIQAEPCNLSLELLSDITDNFSDKREIGRGGFGVVYKGMLENGDVVAVKKLASMPGVNDVQFENEVYHRMMLKHKNIVRFLGYCFETQHVCIMHKGRYCFVEMPEKLLCLEYLPNGSLDRHISDESCGLDWRKRYKIIRGICLLVLGIKDQWLHGTRILAQRNNNKEVRHLQLGSNSHRNNHRTQRWPR